MLADEIGSWHLNVDIDGVISALLSLFQTLTGKCPRYKVTVIKLVLQSFTYLHYCFVLAFSNWSNLHVAESYDVLFTSENLEFSMTTNFILFWCVG